jgi:hypothetical protein
MIVVGSTTGAFLGATQSIVLTSWRLRIGRVSDSLHAG